MIQTFRHRGLGRLWNEGDAKGIRSDLQDRVRRLLSAIDAATSSSDLDLPGWRLHPLRGRPRRHALAVNGPWRITFEWKDGDAWNVDLEQYH
ncbi:MAG TPA: type II toxin-antitoxin system RelE/ParE family toxin [Thermoanaerobaculia bacterium]|nr:type II toxin-antitoxin system RelE/ParE family toxin [Thermoanaerobaculia bacterium]